MSDPNCETGAYIDLSARNVTPDVKDHVISAGEVSRRIRRQSTSICMETILRANVQLRRLQSYNITFRDMMTEIQEAKFRFHRMRPLDDEANDVIRVRDIVILAKYLVQQTLPSHFLQFLDTKAVHRWLRALIIYSHYFIQAAEDAEAITEKRDYQTFSDAAFQKQEAIARSLVDLRALLGQEYSMLLMGALDCRKFHHKPSSQGASKLLRDEMLYELLYRAALRIVWIALGRRNMKVIEAEMERVHRTESFRLSRRSSAEVEGRQLHPDDQVVLHGTQNPFASTFTQNSPLIEDLLKPHDHRLLDVDREGFVSDDAWLNTLHLLLYSPEEKLHEAGIRVGILGQLRKDYDVLLRPIFIPPDLREDSLSPTDSCQALDEETASQETGVSNESKMSTLGAGSTERGRTLSGKKSASPTRAKVKDEDEDSL